MQCEGLPTELYGLYVLGSLVGADLVELQSHLDLDCVSCTSGLREARQIWYGVALAVPQVEPSRRLKRRIAGLVQQPAFWQTAWWQPVAAMAALTVAVALGVRWTEPLRAPAALVAVVPNPGIAPLERENEALRRQLDTLRVAPVPGPTAVREPRLAKSVSPAPRVEENTAALAALTQERQQVAALQQELAQQKQLTDELNRKASAATPQPKPENLDLSRQLAQAQTRTAQLEQDLAQYKSLLAMARQRMESATPAASLLADPNLRVVQLRSTGNNRSIQAHVVLASGTQALLYVSQLPPLPAGRVYQLWLIRDVAPAIVSAGLFQPDARQSATLQFAGGALTTGVTTIAVTDEPDGGSIRPTGHKLLIGS